MSRSWGSMLCLILAVCQLVACSKEKITIQDAWIPEAPPNVPALAGYMTINNDTEDTVTLVNISTTSFERIEIHHTVHNRETGLTRMIRQQTLDIAPRTSLRFKPGGYHLMLIHPRKVIQDGERIPLTLMFSNGQSFDIEFQVQRETLRF